MLRPIRNVLIQHQSLAKQRCVRRLTVFAFNHRSYPKLSPAAPNNGNRQRTQQQQPVAVHTLMRIDDNPIPNRMRVLVSIPQRLPRIVASPPSPHSPPNTTVISPSWRLPPIHAHPSPSPHATSAIHPYPIRQTPLPLRSHVNVPAYAYHILKSQGSDHSRTPGPPPPSPSPHTASPRATDGILIDSPSDCQRRRTTMTGQHRQGLDHPAQSSSSPMPPLSQLALLPDQCPKNASISMPSLLGSTCFTPAQLPQRLRALTKCTASDALASTPNVAGQRQHGVQVTVIHPRIRLSRRAA